MCMPESTSPKKPSRPWRLHVLMAVVLAVGLLGIVLWNRSVNESPEERPESRQFQPVDPDARLRRMVVGI